jgi:hypothetical protein
VLLGRLAAARSAGTPVRELIDTFAGIAGKVRNSEEFANHLAFLLLDLADLQFQQITFLLGPYLAPVPPTTRPAR